MEGVIAGAARIGASVVVVGTKRDRAGPSPQRKVDPMPIGGGALEAALIKLCPVQMFDSVFILSKA